MRKPSGTQLWLFAALGAAVLILLYSAAGTRQSPRAAEKQKETRKTRRARAEKPIVLPPAAPPDADFQRYEMIATRNIFSAPKPPEVKRTDNGSLPPIKPEQRDSQPARQSEPTVARQPSLPPLTGWYYAGYIVLGGKKFGIMQSDSASTSQDVEVGGQFQGYRVESIAGDEIVLAAGAAKQTLKRPGDFQLTPLGGSVAEVKPRG